MLFTSPKKQLGSDLKIKLNESKGYLKKSLLNIRKFRLMKAQHGNKLIMWLLANKFQTIPLFEDFKIHKSFDRML